MNKLDKEIEVFCEANNLEIKEYRNKILKIGFNIDRYGNKPSFLVNKSKDDSLVKELESCKERVLELENILNKSTPEENKEEETDIYGEK